jgi:hypothetical protein
MTDQSGIKITADGMPSAAAAVRKILGTSNPVAVVEFFHYLCEAFFSNLLRSGQDILGIFGNVSAHYGVVVLQTTSLEFTKMYLVSRLPYLTMTSTVNC